MKEGISDTYDEPQAEEAEEACMFVGLMNIY